MTLLNILTAHLPNAVVSGKVGDNGSYQTFTSVKVSDLPRVIANIRASLEATAEGFRTSTAFNDHADAVADRALHASQYFYDELEVCLPGGALNLTFHCPKTDFTVWRLTNVNISIQPDDNMDVATAQGKVLQFVALLLVLNVNRPW